jgi:hypothetical protein
VPHLELTVACFIRSQNDRQLGDLPHPTTNKIAEKGFVIQDSIAIFVEALVEIFPGSFARIIVVVVPFGDNYHSEK